MKPFFSYLGSKWQMAKFYGAPEHETVIEPFAGSAAYSVRWEAPWAKLIDKNPRIVGIWEYLINVKEEEINDLPLMFDSVDDLAIPQEAKWLIGFWINKGNTEPCKTKGAWARQYENSSDCKVWGSAVRQRISSQLHKIRNWEIYEGEYDQLRDDDRATWFIDPPYQVKGRNYTFNKIDYEALGAFCRELDGQVIVCENEGATWLPFRHAKDQRGTFGKNRTGLSVEVVWP